MKPRNSIAVLLLCIPLIAWGVSMTKECAREHSDVVLEGRVTALLSHKLTVGADIHDLTGARISVTNVIKGPCVTNGVITVYYETQPSNTFRCPPYVVLKVGDIGIFAVTTNFQKELGLDLFIGSGDYVEIGTNGLKNANNNTSEGIRQPADGLPKPSR